MDNQRSMINDMTSGPLFKQILLYSAPLMLANVLQTLYNLVDLAIVGQALGSVGLSAVSIAGSITFILYALGMGLGSGTQILIAQQVGTGERDSIRRTTGTSLATTAILAVSVAVIGIFLRNVGLRLLNTPAEAMKDASEYLFWCCLGVPFTYGYGSLSSILRGMGDSKRPMYFVAIAALTNIVLDIALVWWLGMRAKGAAIATSLSQLVSFLFALIYLYRRRESFGFDFRRESFLIDRATLKTITSLAAPLALMSISINISMMFVTAWVNAYGVIASAVSGVGGKLFSVVSIITMSMETADSTVTGQNIAAGKPERVKKALYICTALCLAYWVLLAILSLGFPKALFSLFTSDDAVIAMAPGYMVIQTVNFLGASLMSPPNGLLRGIGHVKLNLAIAIADGIIARIGLSLLLARVFGLGLYGYWWGNCLAGFVSVIAGWAYFFTGRWKDRKLLA